MNDKDKQQDSKEHRGKRIIVDERTGLKPVYFEVRKLIGNLGRLYSFEDHLAVMEIITLLNKLRLVNGYDWHYEALKHEKKKNAIEIVLDCFRCLVNGITLTYDSESGESYFETNPQFNDFKSKLKIINEDKEIKKLISRAITQANSNKNKSASGEELPLGWLEWLYDYLESNPKSTITDALKSLNKKFGSKIDSDKNAYDLFKDTYHEILNEIK